MSLTENGSKSPFGVCLFAKRPGNYCTIIARSLRSPNGLFASLRSAKETDRLLYNNCETGPRRPVFALAVCLFACKSPFGKRDRPFGQLLYNSLSLLPNGDLQAKRPAIVVQQSVFSRKDRAIIVQ